MISSFTEGPPQIDGRRYVTETHTFDDGTVATVEWLGDQDAQPVVDARAAVLLAEWNAKQAAAAQVVGSKLPMTRFEFLSRMTPQERITIRTMAKSDPVIEDFMQLLELSGSVERSNPQTLAGMDYLVMVGALTATRRDEVLA